MTLAILGSPGIPQQSSKMLETVRSIDILPAAQGVRSHDACVHEGIRKNMLMVNILQVKSKETVIQIYPDTCSGGFRWKFEVDGFQAILSGKLRVCYGHGHL